MDAAEYPVVSGKMQRKRTRKREGAIEDAKEK
jgi:hypothetical protein